MNNPFSKSIVICELNIFLDNKKQLLRYVMNMRVIRIKGSKVRPLITEINQVYFNQKSSGFTLLI